MILAKDYIIFESKKDLIENCNIETNSLGQRKFSCNGYEINRYDIDKEPLSYPLVLEKTGCQPQNFVIYYYDFVKNKTFDDVKKEILNYYDIKIAEIINDKMALKKIV